MLLDFAFIKLRFWRLLLPLSQHPALSKVQPEWQQGEDTELLRGDLRSLPAQPIVGFYDQGALTNTVVPAEDTLQSAPLSPADDLISFPDESLKTRQ